DPRDGYFLTHQALQDEFQVGATLWTWHESCGDPHKAGDRRAGNLPYVWGEFEVDCHTNDVLGERIDLVAQLTRAYLRAAPGRITGGSDGEAAGTFSASGDAPTGGVELVAFYPAVKHGAPALSGSGLTGLAAVAAPGGSAYIVAVSSGGSWSITAAPAH